MGNEITKIATTAAGVANASPALSRAVTSVNTSATPKVQAPKPIAINFDPAQVRQDLQDAVNLLNQQLKSTGRGLGFHIDEAVGGPVVTVRSTETGEVVRQIPNETAVHIAHHLDQIKGLLFSAKT